MLPSMTEGQTQSPLTQHHTCAKCDYDLANIDPAGNCPECGTPIINACMWCGYDLSGTDPAGNCPECGVPVAHSIGSSALGPVPTERLRSVHTGFRIVTILILVYIVSAIVTVFGIQLIASNNPDLMYPLTVLSALINNGLIFGIFFGWYKLSQPLTGLSTTIDVPDRRSFVRVMLAVAAVFTLFNLIYAFIPDNSDPDAALSGVDLVFWGISFLSLAAMLILFIANVLYLGWFAKLVRNRKMERRSKHFVWSGPLIAFLGFPLLALGPLITLVIYWNMVEYIRRDLKKVIKARPDA